MLLPRHVFPENNFLYVIKDIVESALLSRYVDFFKQLS